MSKENIIRVMALAVVVFFGFALRVHKVSIDENRKRIQAIEQILWTTNGTLIITQDAVGKYHFSWPNLPPTNSFTNSINVQFEKKTPPQPAP